MPSRDPAEPDGTEEHAANDALTLAEAEAKAAEAEAAAARARAKLLRLQRDSQQDDSTVEVPDSPEAAEEGTAESADPAEGTDESAEPAEPAADAAEEPGWLGRSWHRLRWVAATLAVLATGGLIAGDVLMLVHHHGVKQRQHQSAEYAAAARQGVVTLMSLNYETVDDDVQRILDNSTGEFKKDFESHLDDFTKMAREAKTVTEATATVSGVESMSGGEAVVLVAASTKVTNTAGAKEEPRSWRLTVHVTREGDQIKMSKVDFAT